MIVVNLIESEKSNPDGIQQQHLWYHASKVSHMWSFYTTYITVILFYSIGEDPGLALWLRSIDEYIIPKLAIIKLESPHLFGIQNPKNVVCTKVHGCHDTYQ